MTNENWTEEAQRVLRAEADALCKQAQVLENSFALLCETLLNLQGLLFVSGVGKSGIIARKWASTLSSTGTRAIFMHPAEAGHGDMGALQKQDALLILSLSGQSRELLPLVRCAQRLPIPLLAVTANRDSFLARAAQIVLGVYPQESACPLGIVPMAGTTLLIGLGDAVASCLMRARHFSKSDFGRSHPEGELGWHFHQTIAGIMRTGKSVPCVYEDQPLPEVLLEMTQKRMGATSVISRRHELLGIITDGDLRRYWQSGDPTLHAPAAHLMTAGGIRVPQNILAADARSLMEERAVHHLLVVEETGKLVGLLHLDDLIKRHISNEIL